MFETHKSTHIYLLLTFLLYSKIRKIHCCFCFYFTFISLFYVRTMCASKCNDRLKLQRDVATKTNNENEKSLQLYKWMNTKNSETLQLQSAHHIIIEADFYVWVYCMLCMHIRHTPCNKMECCNLIVWYLRYILCRNCIYCLPV